MQEYLRKVNYYETDKMGIVHHSNYIRWFEEARLDFMEKYGYPYDKFEESGCICPVVSVSCKYKRPIVFGQAVKITVRLKEYKNAKHKFAYTVIDSKTGELHATGESSHCFLNDKGRVVALKKINPEMFEFFEKIANEDSIKTEGEI
ncbi:MAG: acyl-CoA thioesterase [Clostridia bacterium]|nr:acyl-CoA thioesterase [Clostridia bacterium]